MPQIYNLVRRYLASAVAEGAQAQARGGRYGELGTLEFGPVRYPLALEGSYFKAINPTPDTGIASAITAAFSATAALWTLYNADAANGKQIALDYIRIIPTVVPASATRSEVVIAIDNIQRFSSGGSTIAAKGANMDQATASIATFNFGAVVAAAESGNVRRLARAQLRAAIPVAFEELVITFGSESAPGTTTLGGTTAQRNVVDVGPVVIGPGHTLVGHVWHPGNAATPASWEVEAGWWER